MLISTVSLIQHTDIKKHIVLSTTPRAMENINVARDCPCPGGFYSLAGIKDYRNRKQKQVHNHVA